MKKLVITVLFATSLSACSPNKFIESLPVVGAVCTVAEGTLIDEKVVYAATALYVMPANAYVKALPHLTPELKAVLKPKLIQLYSLLKSVRAAQGTVNCDYNAMKELHADILELLPRN